MAKDERVWLAHLLVEKHQVSETSLFGLLDHVLDLVIFSLVVFDTGEGCLHFFQEVEKFLRSIDERLDRD